MKKTAWVILIFAMIFTPIFVSNAVICIQCGQETETLLDYSFLDSNEVKFRKIYLDHLLRYFRATHQGLISEHDLDISKLYEYYHSPSADEYPSKSSEGNIDLKAQLIEREFMLKGLPESIGNSLPYEEIRNDIQETASGLHIFLSELPPPAPQGVNIEQQPVCYKCLGILPVQDQNTLSRKSNHTGTPFNIQLALRLNKIIDSSDIVIILSDQYPTLSANQLLIDYFKLFSQKKVILGLEVFDEDEDFFSRLNIGFRKEYIQKDIGKACGDFDYKDIVSLIIKYGLSSYNSRKYLLSARDYNDPTTDLLRFIERRCCNTNVFGIDTPISTGRFLEPRFFDLASKHYYELLNDICEELEISLLPLAKFGGVNRKELTSMFRSCIKNTKTCRNDIALKISAYFAAVNYEKSPDNRIPFIISVDSNYGLPKDKSGNVQFFNKHERIIQSLIKSRLSDLKLQGVRVTTIRAYAGLPHIFSKEGNKDLDGCYLDYVIFFRAHS
ncbi:hypothetical protein P0136_10990 [Lentisphaerota bacterium ZTH]|nr:hypothetical protein JYG24_11490 [Lentisphaerota bacterium]WET05887.1 hypothetical protein P0136_10990 [Lentisphaerota bacterium ZTH]